MLGAFVTTRGQRNAMMVAVAVLGAGVLVVACGDSADDSAANGAGHNSSSNSAASGTTTGGGQAGAHAGGAGAQGGAAGGDVGGASAGGGPPTPVWQSQLSTISERHRFVDGAMFGGWGPHLGHLLRAPSSQGAGESLWFADDHCAQTAADGPLCDVLHDHSLGYYERVGNSWIERAVIALAGTVQQNTGSLVGNDGILYSYGLDVAGGTILECPYNPKVGALPCSTLPFATGPSANYIGAAISPQGYRLVWWTNVVDGGGGSFRYIIDYGGGFNGPRIGGTAGYNDAAYINIAFGGASANDFTLHAQTVSGLAPNWDFHGIVGYGDMGSSDAVSWSNALAPVNGDAVVSTNDVWTDPASGDTHLLARLEGGQAAYYFRPQGGAWSAASWLLAGAYRARWLLTQEHLALVTGTATDSLQARIVRRADIAPGMPVPWPEEPDEVVALAAGFGAVYAIYPESHAYQTGVSDSLNMALVGANAQYRVTHVSLSYSLP